ncbi:1a667816-6388-456f-8f71-85c5c1fcc189 [Thermothielavioides terrestris]|uniref:1a667816-6388-456f-8f71-85c5c1fcc189 n=1 Tax=Thermothielavioides terrestris TaxID=2587410 RepID=A0A446BND5_9PEZI|nr:1a667816-6388-456f-8f71-85c5c1fcc189 [Thermothielavioides terrestris]
MPTAHVEPGCDPLLQDIANTLWKARKIVVITGAGISTNSGIPDFRSENGLYSLIQAQFEAAQQKAHGSSTNATVPEAPLDERPRKRPRIADDEPERPFPGLYKPAAKNEARAAEDMSPPRDRPRSPSPQEPRSDAGMAAQEPVSPLTGLDSPLRSSTPLLSPPTSPWRPNPNDTNPTLSAAEDSAAITSSPPRLNLGTPRPMTKLSHLNSLPGSSSPLSSPPPITFDPYQESTDSSGESDDDSSQSRRSETSSSSTPLLSSQTSFASSRASLPIMKGRDLFDARIWSCPIKTSVFYTFVSTLRQKVRSAEPTSSHRFVSVLRDSRKLVRCYTQNIDQLEERVGLSTSLSLGAGSRYRFSLRASRSSSGLNRSNKVTDGNADDTQGLEPGAPLSQSASDSVSSGPAAPNRGVECVFLHGSLAELRCFVCARTASWDEEARLADTLAGRQPTCPHCAGAAAAREEKGKRALGVGKLRPDIVLYGEEHPHAHLISPLVQHDLSLGPDMLLILGTSMRVHGLKVLVREFAKAVHDRGGKVVFVNFTKPPESVWADIIDYWVQWDCDAWVGDLRKRKPALWLPPGAALPEDEKQKTTRVSRRQSGPESSKRKDGAERASKKRRESGTLASNQSRRDGRRLSGDVDGQERCNPTLPLEVPAQATSPSPKTVPKKPAKAPRERVLNPNAKRPASTRDHKLNGAYLVGRIMANLRRISGRSVDAPAVGALSRNSPRPRAKKPRKSAPAAFKADKAAAVEPSPSVPVSMAQTTATASTPLPNAKPYEPLVFTSDSSISAAVKSRKRKQAVAWRMIRGVETLVSLDDGAEPKTSSLPHTAIVFRPSPVPEPLRLPLPTPTAPLPSPAYRPSHAQQPAVATSALPRGIDLDAGFRETDRLIAQMQRQQATTNPTTSLALPPHNPGRAAPPPLKHLPFAAQEDHRRKPAALEPKVESPGPRAEISSNVGSPASASSARMPAAGVVGCGWSGTATVTAMGTGTASATARGMARGTVTGTVTATATARGTATAAVTSISEISCCRANRRGR